MSRSDVAIHLENLCGLQGAEHNSWTARFVARAYRSTRRASVMYISYDDSIELHLDRQNESNEMWSELISIRYGPVALTFSGLGSTSCSVAANPQNFSHLL
jgi:hypothetical protein